MVNCIDCGSENCPCVLAESGDCLTCSRLQGKDFCDCNWRGVCIYNEYIQNFKKVQNSRELQEVNILSKLKFPDELYVLCLDVGKGFALKASHPGSFVFLQPELNTPYYSTPISVLASDIDSGVLYVAVKNVGVKTKSICSKEDKLFMKGVYRNGIIGLTQFVLKLKYPHITSNVPESADIPQFKQERLMIITKGVGFAPAINLINLCWDKCPVDIVIDKDKICSELVRDFLNPAMTESLSLVSLANPVSLDTLRSRIQEGSYTAVAVFASEYYQSEIKKFLLPDIHFMFSNNTTLCCGEGICGACGFGNQYGQVHKACKCY